MRDLVGAIKKQPLWLALLAGFVLRLIGIQSRSLQYDDVFSIFLSRRSLPEIVSGTAADTMPPLYYFLLHFWMLLSQEIWFIRLLSLLISLGIIWILYHLTLEWFGKPAAAWAALIAAVSPLQIYYGQEVRMYSLLVLGQVGYAWFFTRIWLNRQPGRRWANWAGLVIFGLIAMYSHNLAVFVLVVPSVFLVFKRAWKLLARLTLAQFIVGLGALPWLLYLPGQISKIQAAFWTPRPGVVEILQTLIMFHAAMPLPSILLTAAAAIISILIVTVVVLELRRAERPAHGTAFMICLLLIPPLLLFVVSYLMRPVFVPRGFQTASLAYFALAGYAISQSWRRGPGKLIAAGFLIAALFSLPYHYSFQSFPRSPYRQAVDHLLAEDLAGAVIVHDSKLSYFPMHFLAADLPQVFLADTPGSGNDTFAPASQQAMQVIPEADLDTAVGSSERVYFVTYSQTFDEYDGLGLGQHPALGWLEARFVLAGHRVFNDLEIFTFTK